MGRTITVFVILALYFSPCNGLFFGLFNSKQTSKPDLIISETKDADTGKAAYEQYLRRIKQIQPLHTQVRYVTMVYQPRYPEHVNHQPNLIVHPSMNYYDTASVQVKYPQQMANPSYIQRPIIVLPSEAFESISEKTKDLDNLINSDANSVKYVVPEPQVTTTLYDLPLSNIAPDFRTGGYVSSPLVRKVKSNKRSDLSL